MYIIGDASVAPRGSAAHQPLNPARQLSYPRVAGIQSSPAELGARELQPERSIDASSSTTRTTAWVGGLIVDGRHGMQRRRDCSCRRGKRPVPPP